MIALLYSNSAVAVMNKTLVFLFYSLISVPMVHANNLSDGWFIGVSGNSFNRDISIVDTESGKEMQDIHSGSMSEQLDSGTAFGVSIGKQLTGGFRLSISYETNKESKYSYNLGPTGSGSLYSHLTYSIEQQEFRLSGDYLLPIFDNPALKPYLGLHFGLSDINYSFEREYTLGWTNHYGAEGSNVSWLAGFQAGLEYYLTSKLSAGVGLRYSYYDHDLLTDSPTFITYFPEEHNLKIRSQGSAFLELKYHF
mgnify:CR=1 FL=1